MIFPRYKIELMGKVALFAKMQTFQHACMAYLAYEYASKGEPND